MVLSAFFFALAALAKPTGMFDVVSFYDIIYSDLFLISGNHFYIIMSNRIGFCITNYEC
jgi:hypothetical protein